MVRVRRVRQAVYLGLREDKSASEVVRDPADLRGEESWSATSTAGNAVAAKRGPVVAVPPRRNRPNIRHLRGRAATS